MQNLIDTLKQLIDAASMLLSDPTITIEKRNRIYTVYIQANAAVKTLEPQQGKQLTTSDAVTTGQHRSIK